MTMSAVTADRMPALGTTTVPRSTCSRRLRLASSVLAAIGRRSECVEPEVRGLSDHVSAGDVCLDIGSEYGLYTFSLAALAGPEGHVVAVEPNPSLSWWLSRAARTLRVDSVTVVAAAMGDHVGSSELSVPRRRLLPVHGRAYVVAGALDEGANSEFATSRRSPVRMDTVDEMCSALRLEHVAFVKADVEGAELAVLHGSTEMLRRSRPKVLLEIEQRHLDRFGRRVSDVLDFFLAENYSMNWWRGGRWEPASEVTTDNRNYLFLPRERAEVHTLKAESS